LACSRKFSLLEFKLCFSLYCLFFIPSGGIGRANAHIPVGRFFHGLPNIATQKKVYLHIQKYFFTASKSFPAVFYMYFDSFLFYLGVMLSFLAWFPLFVRLSSFFFRICTTAVSRASTAARASKSRSLPEVLEGNAVSRASTAARNQSAKFFFFAATILCAVATNVDYCSARHSFSSADFAVSVLSSFDSSSDSSSVSLTDSLETAESTSASASSLGALLREKATAAQSAAAVELFAPLREHGRLFMRSTQASYAIDKRDWQALDYSGLAEILWERLPAFPLGLGMQGAFNHLSLFGAGARDIAVQMNGRPMAEPSLGATFLEQLSPEAIESIEAYIGSDAVILANNASGAALNIQEIRHDTKNLYTRLWYHQFGDQYTAADLDASYNVAPNVNLTLGARTQQGNRIYNNTGLRAWNARMILRWYASSSANVSLSYFFTQHRNAANGGLQSATDASVTSSAPIFNELQESAFRHDLTLTGSAFLSRDSSVSAGLSVFASWSERALERASLQNFTASGQNAGNFLPDETIEQTTGASWTLGAAGRLETNVTLFSALEASLLVGGLASVQSVPDNIYWSAGARLGEEIVQRAQGELSGFGRLKFLLLNSVEISGGARLSIVGERPELALGARASLWLTREREIKRGAARETERETERETTQETSLQLWADASRGFRLPSIAEDGAAGLAAQATELRAETHLLALAGLRFGFASPERVLRAELLGFARLITNPIVYDSVSVPFTRVGDTLPRTLSTIMATNAESRFISGLTASVSWRQEEFALGAGIVANAFASATLSETSDAPDGRFPLLYAGASVQLQYRFGRDLLRAGVRLRLTTPFVGERFAPTLWAYIPSDASQEQGLAGNGIDLIASAEVFGSLIIRATYQNALNSTAFTVAGYPQYPTVLRLGVSATILGI
jgi:hypothetical protein